MRWFSSWILLIPLCLPACGKRDDPAPPVPVIPAATSDVVVAQRGDSIVLSWSYPILTTAGRNLPGVDRIEILRLVQPLPPSAAGVDAALPAAPGPPWERVRFADVPLPTPALFRRDAEVIATLSRAEMPAAVAGSRVVFTDRLPFRVEGRPVRVVYGVRTSLADAVSDISNLGSIVPLEVSGPPRALNAEAEATGVRLEWEAPADAAENPPAGYLVYRFDREGAAAITDGAPVHAAPLTDTQYLDVPPFGEWSYAVTALRDLGPPPVESVPSGFATAAFRDIQPPAPPEGVNTLLADRSVRVIWEAGDAADVAGYHVYRALQGQTRVRLTTNPVTRPEWNDVPPPGRFYIYSVTAVDAAGNESTATSADTILVPG